MTMTMMINQNSKNKLFGGKLHISMMLKTGDAQNYHSALNV